MLTYLKDKDQIIRLKGEITLTDLAQSESSLAGARVDLIKAKTVIIITDKF